MCGIAGIVSLTAGAPAAEQTEVLAMAERLRHRGPDRLSSWVSPSGRCALSHSRLGVIDLETGDQPMSNEASSVQVVFNGEIYNFQDVRAELLAAGHRFSTKSDTEVLVHGYEEWGDALVERVDGMFAFALWDGPRGRLTLARDRVGKKPLYWVRVGDRIAFASEVKALLALKWVPNEVDPDAFPYYLNFGYVPEPRTFYRDIRILPPASVVTVDVTGEGGREDPVPRRYWRLAWGADPELRAKEASQGVRQLLRDAVERRLVADVPLGAFLSGGIDSTIVVGLMRELVDGPIRTFSLGFADDPTYDETRYARMAADRFGTDHTEFIVEADQVSRVADLVEAYDQPFGDSSAIPTHIVSELTREHVTVALTGDGGDEMFAGYPRFLAMELANRVPGPLASVGNALGHMLPQHSNFRHPTRRFSQFFGAAALEPEQRMLRWTGFFPDSLDELLREDRFSATCSEALMESYRVAWERPDTDSSLARTLSLNFETYLPEDLLLKADRCSMAHGLELRSPFLDTSVMEFAARLPDRMRIRGVRQRGLKWILRSAFSDLLPEPIARRPKMGFAIPLPVWFRTSWKERFEDLVLSDGAKVGEWLNLEPIRRIWAEHQGGHDHGHKLWALLTLETWLRSR